MNLEEFQNEERKKGQVDIIDPNVARMLAKQNENQEAPEVSKILGTQETPKKHTPMDVTSIAGIKTEKEPEKITSQEAVLSDLDKAIERKQREARLMSAAIDESNDLGEPLSEEEFKDILDQNKDYINGDSEMVETTMVMQNDGVNKNGSSYDIDQVLSKSNENVSFEEELEREAAELEDDYEPDDSIMTEEEYDSYDEVMDNSNVVPMRKTESPTPDTNTDMSYEDASKMFDKLNEEIASGDIDYDKELQDLDDNSEQSETDRLAKERTDKLSALVKEKIRPVTKAFDITGFSISEKPAASHIETPRAKKDDIADWVLMSSQRPIYMRKFTGAEMERLSNGGRGRTRLNRALDTWTLIYNHVVDPYKPKTVEEWAKGISFLDIDHIYMAIYRANFGKSNFIPYNCEECNEVFLADDVDIMDMCKFETPESRKLFDSIIGTECTPGGYSYSTEIIPISDQYAFKFRDPSIYNIIFESAVLDEDFVNKFGDMVSFASYIDKIYYINMDTRELQPVKTNVYRNNMQKTARARIIKFSQIMSTLNSDQYNTLIAYMQNINKSGELLTYQFPEATCPKCKTQIPAVSMEASRMVFTRHQLAALASS